MQETGVAMDCMESTEPSNTTNQTATQPVPRKSSKRVVKTAKCSVNKILIPTEPELSEGDLVFAKLSGHAWWPGMVARDISSDLHMKCKAKGTNGFNGRTYHIQFLGPLEGHAWVTAQKCVSIRDDTSLKQQTDLLLAPSLRQSSSQRTKRLEMGIGYQKQLLCFNNQTRVDWYYHELLGIPANNRIAIKYEGLLVTKTLCDNEEKQREKTKEIKGTQQRGRQKIVKTEAPAPKPNGKVGTVKRQTVSHLQKGNKEPAKNQTRRGRTSNAQKINNLGVKAERKPAQRGRPRNLKHENVVKLDAPVQFSTKSNRKHTKQKTFKHPEEGDITVIQSASTSSEVSVVKTSPGQFHSTGVNLSIVKQEIVLDDLEENGGYSTGDYFAPQGEPVVILERLPAATDLLSATCSPNNSNVCVKSEKQVKVLSCSRLVPYQKRKTSDRNKTKELKTKTCCPIITAVVSESVRQLRCVICNVRFLTQQLTCTHVYNHNLRELFDSQLLKSCHRTKREC